MRIALATPMREARFLGAALGAAMLKLGNAPCEITGITTDSREVRRGDLFVAVRGKKQNGNDFVKTALQKGAAAILTEEIITGTGDYWLFTVPDVTAALQAAAGVRRDLTAATVVAISGSTGKTTVKEIVAAVLGEKGSVQKSEGNFNSALGMPLSLLGMEEADFFVLELGINHPGEMEGLSRLLAPDLTVLTNVGSAHIGHFADYATLLAEKLKLTSGQGRCGIALLSDTVPAAARKGLLPRILTVGTDGKSDFCISNAVMSSDGVRGEVNGQSRTVGELFWPIPGSIGLSCIAFAAAVGILFGLSDNAIRQGLFSAAAAAPRMRRLSFGGLCVIDDSYNASPEAMIAALESLSYLAKGHPSAAVLGDIGELGEHAAALHEAVGVCAAESGIAHLFTYGEYATDLANGAVRGGMDAAFVHAFSYDDTDSLAAAVFRLMPKDSTVLFKASRKTGLERVIAKMGGWT